MYVMKTAEHLTWDNVARIHGILILDEAETIHELDLSDLASTVGGEVILDICLGSYFQIPWSAKRSSMVNNPSWIHQVEDLQSSRLHSSEDSSIPLRGRFPK